LLSRRLDRVGLEDKRVQPRGLSPDRVLLTRKPHRCVVVPFLFDLLGYLFDSLFVFLVRVRKDRTDGDDPDVTVQ
jgi:hypothetical protein